MIWVYKSENKSEFSNSIQIFWDNAVSGKLWLSECHTITSNCLPWLQGSQVIQLPSSLSRLLFLDSKQLIGRFSSLQRSLHHHWPRTLLVSESDWQALGLPVLNISLLNTLARNLCLWIYQMFKQISSHPYLYAVKHHISRCHLFGQECGFMCLRIIRTGLPAYTAWYLSSNAWCQRRQLHIPDRQSFVHNRKALGFHCEANDRTAICHALINTRSAWNTWKWSSVPSRRQAKGSQKLFFQSQGVTRWPLIVMYSRSTVGYRKQLQLSFKCFLVFLSVLSLALKVVKILSLRLVGAVVLSLWYQASS